MRHDWRKNTTLAEALRCAVRGWHVALYEERRWQLASVAVAGVVGVGVWLDVPIAGLLAATGAWVAVLALEAVNAAMERLADVLHPVVDGRIRDAKDLLAGAVLLIVLVALVATAVVFVPVIVRLVY